MRDQCMKTGATTKPQIEAPIRAAGDGDKRRARGNGDLHDTDLTNEKIEQTT
jgi:hypothetical protein